MGDEAIFNIGDIVTRDGSDEQEILDIDLGFGTLIVRCIKEPIAEEGRNPWIRLGEEEHNLIRRYSLVRRKAQ
jgi:hypothetical protein